MNNKAYQVLTKMIDAIYRRNSNKRIAYRRASQTILDCHYDKIFDDDTARALRKYNANKFFENSWQTANRMI